MQEKIAVKSNLFIADSLMVNESGYFGLAKIGHTKANERQTILKNFF